MEIKVIGAGCDSCGALYDHTVEAVERLGLDTQVEKVDDLVEMVKLGVMQVPALMVDRKVLAAGQVLSTDKICKLLKK